MISRKFPVWLTIEKKERSLFFALMAMYGIYVLPVILANRLYQDDLSHSLYGVTGWYNDARPLSEKLIVWLCGGSPLGDVFPLPLLLSIPLLAFAVTLFVKRFLPSQGLSFPALSLGFLVIANPFLLCNLSYRFEAVTMILALCAAMLPYAAPAEMPPLKVFIFSFFLCMITFTTYQSAIGVFISLWFIELFYMLCSCRIDPLRLLARPAACVCGAVIYKFIILNHYIRPENGGWQSDAYRFGQNAEGGFFSVILLNMESLMQHINLVLQGVPMPVLILFLFLMAAGILFACLSFFRQDFPLYRRLLSILYALLLPFLIILGAAAPLLVLTPTSFNISAHSLICLCSIGIWAGVMLSFLPSAGRQLWALLFLPCLLFGLTFSYTYGNALTSQKQYEEYLTYSIVHDLETINADGAYQTVTIAGRAPYAPETARLCEKYPLLTRLVPTYITNSSYLGGVQLLLYTQETFSFESLTEEDETLIKTGEPVVTTSIYSCYKADNKIIIHFNR